MEKCVKQLVEENNTLEVGNFEEEFAKKQHKPIENDDEYINF